MTTNKKVFTLRLNENNFEKIKIIAEKNKRSIAMQIEYLIEQHIDKYEKENGTIQLND
ncbi:Arc family DNA-binding protein [Paenibacillus oleatilyticus]|uniref:Arc family DNA-binding protein n=1 Tax=Paenibacillus oleatilyticus TaxID=2594886 RepID=A0ABV4UWQ4_9BACL